MFGEDGGATYYIYRTRSAHTLFLNITKERSLKHLVLWVKRKCSELIFLCWVLLFDCLFFEQPKKWTSVILLLLKACKICKFINQVSKIFRFLKRFLNYKSYSCDWRNAKIVLRKRHHSNWLRWKMEYQQLETLLN